jgi:antitoxin MazE6
MKTAISIPETLFRSADKLAQRLGVSRSELYSKAVAELVASNQDDLVTARLNQIYGDRSEESSLDHDLALLQYRSLTRKNKR